MKLSDFKRWVMNYSKSFENNEPNSLQWTIIKEKLEVEVANRPSSKIKHETLLDAILLTPALSQKIHTSERTLEGWRVSGEGPPFVKIGPSKIGYIWGSVLEWLKSREHNFTSEEPPQA